jgi:precorrin-6B methylase 2
MSLKMEDILKPGAKLSAKALSIEDVRELLAATEKKQDEILRLKYVDYEKLKHSYITI